MKIADPNQNVYARIICKKNSRGSSSGYELHYHPYLNLLTVAGGGSNYGTATGVNLDTGWHHLAATVSGTTARLYVDGMNRTTDSTVSSLRTSTYPVHLGKRTGASGGYLRGSLDEVRISRVARSAAWIAAQHRSMIDSLIQYGAEEGI